jgi:hypothetical protein
MLARSPRAAARRRGVVLILILAMLGLLALIGVTFATFSGQSQVGAKNYAEAAKRLDPDLIIDFGLAQLINDTDNPVSAIRGHSLKRDMYGDDATAGFGLDFLPNGLPMILTSVATQQILLAPNPPSIVVTTNIPYNNYNFPSLVGVDFTGWFLRLELWQYNNAGVPVTQVVPPVAQTFQVQADLNAGGVHQFVLSSNDFRTSYGATDFHLVQPDELGLGNGPVSNSLNRRLHVQLDNRYRFAFNGPGMGTAGIYGNFRLNGPVQSGLPTPLGNPAAVGMDEDYDAPDLDNWFLAVQSADGSVVLPSFHRPGILRYQEDATGNVLMDDWRDIDLVNTSLTPFLRQVSSRSRFLRPRRADHPRSGSSFPDLRPDTSGNPTTNPNFGKVAYDVDNDGDGVKDSVWLDLGFPVQRDAAGKLYKPMFSFMVLGLNGRLPLNTAGNLQGRTLVERTPPSPNNPYDRTAIAHPTEIGLPTYDHTSHLGTSPSEVNPKYALQGPPPLDLSGNPTGFDMFDNAGVDVSVTQLRNLLAGTRPQPRPIVRGPWASWTGGGTIARPAGNTNLDTNYTPFGNLAGGQVDYYYMPNGMLEAGISPGANDDGAARNVPPVAGRWGEVDAVPVTTAATAAGVPYYNSWVGPGRSVFNDPAQAGAVNRVDGIDDNYDGLDFVPVGGSANEYERADFNDPAYPGTTYLSRLPAERYRRFVTPIDLAGTGRVVRFDSPPNLSNPNEGVLLAGQIVPKYAAGHGYDSRGRVSFLHYFRPPGILPEVVQAPLSLPPNPLLDNTVYYYRHNNNNLLHGFESHRTPRGIFAAMMGAAPYNVTNKGTDPLTGNVHLLPPSKAPSWNYAPLPTGWTGAAPPANILITGAPVDPNFPTDPSGLRDYGDDGNPMTPRPYDPPNGWVYPGGGLGLNDASEMNLYVPTQVDAPFGPGDLEWLYRQQDVDGRSLTSRLAQLAPLSFTNTFDLSSVALQAAATDGLARRRMFSVESWDLNTYAVGHGTNMFQSSATPPGSSYVDFKVDFAAQRPVGTDAAGNPILIPIRQTGLSLAHRERRINLNFPLPVSTLPNEPVRQKWVRETYTLLKQVLPPGAVDTPEELAALSQYVVNIIDFRDPDAAATRFVNTDIVVIPATAITQPRLVIRDVNPNDEGNTGVDATPREDLLRLPAGVEPYDPSITVPSPATGPVFLEQFGMEYSPIALNEVLAFSFKRLVGGPPAPQDTPRFFVEVVNTLTKDGHRAGGGTPDTSDLNLFELGYDLVIREDNAEGRPDPVNGQLPPAPTPVPLDAVTRLSYAAGAPTASPAMDDDGAGVQNYHYVFSNTNTAEATSENQPPSVESKSIPDVFFPQMGTGANVIPSRTNPKYYWLYLRRPANPNAPYQVNPTLPGYNPMVVVDSIRFPYTEAGFDPVVDLMTNMLNPAPTAATVPQRLYSTQRLQPYRGGQMVPVLPVPAPPTRPDIDFRYGYSEQTTTGDDTSTWPPGVNSYHGMFNVQNQYLTREIHHTLGGQNDPRDGTWDYFPFHDRDFQSVAELLLVPGCPPGMFTKRFVEAAPDDDNDPTTAPVQWIDYDPDYDGTDNDPLTAPEPARWDDMVKPPQIRPSQNVFVLPGSPVRRVSATGQPLNDGTENVIPGGMNPPAESIAPIPRVYPYLATIDRDPIVAIPGPPATTIPTPPQVQGLVNKFFYSVPFDPTAAAQDPSVEDGWHKMLEYFEVPTPTLGAISEVAAGHNADWYRQDRRPGQLNLNLIIDEEVFFGLIDDPRLSLERTQKPIPRMVTQVDATGTPYVNPTTTFTEGSYPMANRGFVARPPFSGPADGFMKAAFADFLKLRHGGNSNFIYHFLQGERPFRSLSNPDITRTVLRPAHVRNLPAAGTVLDASGNVVSTVSVRGLIPPGSRNDSINMRAVNRTGVDQLPTPSNSIALNTVPPNVPNTIDTTGVTAPFNVPSPVLPQLPHRRLFQVPDVMGSLGAGPYSQAAEQPLGIPPAQLIHATLDKEYASLMPGTDKYVFLGGNTAQNEFPQRVDRRQHPYWRTEWLQKVMNLTTVRTHQYAVWVTVGYFEVLQTGNAQLASDPARFTEAVDELGPEIGAAQGRATRYRAFFVLDRTKATGFNPRNPGDFRELVQFRRRIE